MQHWGLGIGTLPFSTRGYALSVAIRGRSLHVACFPGGVRQARCIAGDWEDKYVNLDSN